VSTASFGRATESGSLSGRGPARHRQLPDGLFGDSRGNLWGRLHQGRVRTAGRTMIGSRSFRLVLNVRNFAEDGTGTVWGLSAGTTVVKWRFPQPARARVRATDRREQLSLARRSQRRLLAGNSCKGLIHLTGDNFGLVKQYAGGAALNERPCPDASCGTAKGTSGRVRKTGSTG